MQELLKELVEKNREKAKGGKVANYIPELSKANSNHLGISMIDIEGNRFSYGEYDVKFTLQSVSKVLVLMLAIMDNGEEYVFSKVGMEPSGDPFNSIKKLETSSKRKPYNPMINAGAIATTSMIKGKNSEEKFNRILEFSRIVMEDETLEVNHKIYLSESETGFRNRAMAYFLKGDGIIEGDTNEALENYFKQCSIEATTESLANLGLFLARNGVLSNGERIIDKRISRIIKAMITTCGMYDKSGEFALRVGLPSKSGVGGGIMSVVPNKIGIGVYGPSLDLNGNSIAGCSLLEDLENRLNFSIF